MRLLLSKPRYVAVAMFMTLVLGFALGGWNSAERELKAERARNADLDARNASLIYVTGMVAAAWRGEQKAAGAYDAQAERFKKALDDTNKRVDGLSRNRNRLARELRETQKTLDFLRVRGWTSEAEVKVKADDK